MGSGNHVTVEGSSVDLRELNDALASSSTKWRLAELSQLEQELEEGSFPETLSDDLVTTLFRTYSFYRDRPSRKAVRDCLQILLSHERYSNIIHHLVTTFAEEASKTNLAASNAFVLVEWGSLIIAKCGKREQLWQSYGTRLVSLHAQILETCIAAKGRHSVKHSALVVTGRALRTTFQGKDEEQKLEQAVSQLTDTPSKVGSRAAVLLGVIAGVCARRPQLKVIFEKQKSRYISFFLRDVIGSRIAVPSHLANALADFFLEFITLEDMQKDIAPAIEKALLRAPEVVLNDIVSPLIISLPEDVDMAPLLADRLAKPLLSNMKSSNPKIRDGAATTFINVIKHSQDEKNLAKVTDEVLTPLAASKLTAAEHRILHSRVLANLRVSSTCSEATCKALATVAIKETSEAALSAELQALSHHLCFLARSKAESPESSFKSCAETACKGLSDKKPANRRAWVLMIGDVVWRTQKLWDVQEVQLFVETTTPTMLELYKEVTSNVLSATQSGMVVVGFVLTALCTYILNVVENGKLITSIRKASIYEQACSLNPKTSFLLSHRVYSKLTIGEDLRWAIRALVACLPYISSAAGESIPGDAWAQTFVYFVTAAAIPHEVRKEAAAALNECYLGQPSQVSQYIIEGLWSWREQLTSGQQDSPAAASKSSNDRLHLAIKAICPTSDQVKSNSSLSPVLLRDQFIKMVVLCRPPLIMHINWIEVCLAAGQDPGDLVRLASERCLAEIKSHTDAGVNGAHRREIMIATYDAAAELAFVAPDSIIPLLMQEVKNYLSASLVRSYSPSDIAIARTPDGITFIDVLSSKKDDTIDKKAKDYNTLKWEAEVRSQLAAKKDQGRKLSADERAKVDAQLNKEAAIRREVLALENRLRRGIEIVSALTNGPPTDAGMWFGTCSKALLDTIVADVGLMIGDSAEMAYLDLAKLVSPRLGSLRQFTGVATLRALGNSTLPETMKQEPLGGMYHRSKSRVCYAKSNRTCHEGFVSLAIPE
ncbi:MAG: hypothetical protein Q9225_002716 [Loekoesia sp. 1 TL-2023]